MHLLALALRDPGATARSAATIGMAPGFQLWVVLVTAAIFAAAATALLVAARR